ncbi:MAG: tetratricopeptide repeat protein [bacterium]|nr:tetratricopeptide repeat protein [bacterium]
MRESILVKILKYGIYLTAFVPLIIFKDFISPFHFGKVVIFRSIIDVLFVFYLVLVWNNKSYLPARNLIFWSVGVFTAVFGLTTLTSIQPYDSFWGYLERMGGFWSFIHYFIYFIILTSIFRKKEDWAQLINVALFVGFLSALYGFFQKTDIAFFVGSGGRGRIFGTIGNAALFAGYELIVSFLALTLFFSKDRISGWIRIFYATVFLTASTAILMTATRGAILGLVVGVFIFFTLYTLLNKSRKLRIAFVWVIIFIIASVFISQVFKDSEFIKGSRYLVRVTDLSLSSYTVQTRFWAWEAGLKGWRENPKTILFGWGPENFNIPFSKNFNPNFYVGPGSETLFDRAHNMFVEILVTMGVVGFVAYVAIFYFLLRSLWRLFRNKLKENLKDEAIYYAGLFSLIVAYVIHNFFFFDTSANFILFFTVLGLISFLLSGTNNIQESPRINKKLSNPRVLTMIILLVGAMFVIYKTNIIPSKANYATTRAIVRGWGNDPVGAVEKFKESVAYNNFGTYEYRHRYAIFTFDNYAKLGDNAYILDVINEVKKNAESHPIDYLPHLYLARLYIVLGKDDPSSEYNDIALVHARRAIELSPTFVRAYYETGQAYLNKKEPQNAVEEFKKAAELQPDVGVTYWYWGSVEAENGNLDEAAMVFEKAFTAKYSYTASDAELLKIAGLYVDRKNFSMLANIYERLMTLQEPNPQNHATLSYVYAQLGRIDDAVEQARKAVSLDPSFEAEAKIFVNSLGREW